MHADGRLCIADTWPEPLPSPSILTSSAHQQLSKSPKTGLISLLAANNMPAFDHGCQAAVTLEEGCIGDDAAATAPAPAATVPAAAPAAAQLAAASASASNHLIAEAPTEGANAATVQLETSASCNIHLLRWPLDHVALGNRRLSVGNSCYVVTGHCIICRVDDSMAMVECTGCRRFTHLVCAGLSEADISQVGVTLPSAPSPNRTWLLWKSHFVWSIVS